MCVVEVSVYVIVHNGVRDSVMTPHLPLQAADGAFPTSVLPLLRTCLDGCMVSALGRYVEAGMLVQAL